MRPTRLGALLTGVLAASVLTGCGVGPFRAAPCLPSPLTAEPATVVVGGSVRLSSPPFRCDAGYREGKRYTLALFFLGRMEAVELGSFPVDVDGTFRARITVPPAASPGEAYVHVAGSPYDEPCGDGESSCASYGVSLTLRPAVRAAGR